MECRTCQVPVDQAGFWAHLRDGHTVAVDWTKEWKEGQE